MIEKNNSDLDVNDLMNRLNQVVDSQKKDLYSISTLEGRDFTLSAIERLAEEGINAATEAESATTVKSKLPKFFNPLLRKQNVVNRRLIKGLRDICQATWQCTHLLYSKIKIIVSRLDRLEEKESLNTRLICNMQTQIANQDRLIKQLLAKGTSAQSQQTISESNPIPIDYDQSKLDSFYLQFENKFRGSQGEIAERQKFYLPILENTGISKSEATIVDIGCGRGEWLKMLNKRDFTTLGLDLNESMIQECNNAGLNVKQANALEYLANIEENSLLAITGFHIIEHIPFPMLIELFQHCLRALKDGGLMIFETPNPENLQVGSCSFHLDYTHQKPYPPVLIEFLSEYTGFSQSKIERLHPYPIEHGLSTNDSNSEKLNNLIYGPQDFAIIAKK